MDPLRHRTSFYPPPDGCHLESRINCSHQQTAQSTTAPPSDHRTTMKIHAFDMKHIQMKETALALLLPPITLLHRSTAPRDAPKVTAKCSKNQGGEFPYSSFGIKSFYLPIKMLLTESKATKGKCRAHAAHSTWGPALLAEWLFRRKGDKRSGSSSSSPESISGCGKPLSEH